MPENSPDCMPKRDFTMQNRSENPSRQILKWPLVHGLSLRYDESGG